MKHLHRLRWFFSLVWQPWHGGPITISEAWVSAGILSGVINGQVKELRQ